MERYRARNRRPTDSFQRMRRGWPAWRRTPAGRRSPGARLHTRSRLGDEADVCLESQVFSFQNPPSEWLGIATHSIPAASGLRRNTLSHDPWAMLPGCNHRRPRPAHNRFRFGVAVRIQILIQDLEYLLPLVQAGGLPFLGE